MNLLTLLLSANIYQVLPVGKELLSCLLALRLFWSSAKGKDTLLSLCLHVKSSSIEEQELEKKFENGLNRDFTLDWKEHPPLLCCWETLLRTPASKDDLPTYTVQAIGILSLGALSFCMDGERSVCPCSIFTSCMVGTMGALVKCEDSACFSDTWQ